MNKVTRRTLLRSAASAAATAGLRARSDESAAPIPALRTFPYGAVQLTGGPLKRQFDENHNFYLHLSEDRLLKIYRQRAGLPAPGENMGGWYDDFCPGAHFGQYVSALARFSAVTSSRETRAKVGRLVHGYARTLDASGKIFVDLRYPAYTYDKLVCMLNDAHSCVGERDAAAILQSTTRAARPHMAEKALTKQERLERPHKDETYT
ncbi:MAG: beta-L-arabinofuranosidase domain-containing protein, partial [Bryobacteraceae bacterium]